MQKSGFFNALRTVNGDYDRKYNADDYCNNLAVVISNGVLRGVDDDLKVTASGMVVTVGKGRAWIDGHYFYNDTAHSFAATTAPSGGARYDRVFLRLNKSLAVRSVSLVYVQGTAGNYPTPPAPVRNGDIYDLVIADIYIGTQATSVTVTDRRGDQSLCGWVYSTSGDNSFFTSLDAAFDEWFNKAKTDFGKDVTQLDSDFNAWFSNTKDTVATVTTEVEYRQLTVLSAQTKTVQITIPQYNAAINQKLNVYVNGMRQYTPNDYTVSGAVITFAGNLTAGTEVTIYITVSKDGSGIPSIVGEVSDLQTRVAALENDLDANTYNYVCNGASDNKEISQLVTTWLNGGTDYGHLTIKVHGNIGITGAEGGDGTPMSPYIWFRAGAGGTTNRRVTLDFSNCSQITVDCPDDTVNIVFFGLQADIIGANVVATGGASITMFSTAALTQANADKCRFWITSAAGYIARGGTFRDCRATVTITGDNAYCFNVLSGGLLRIFGGEYYAYTGTGGMSQVIYVNSAQAGAVVNTYSMSCPTNARNGYVQTYAINCLTNDACCSFTDTITNLEIVAAGQNIRGTIKQSKAVM